METKKVSVVHLQIVKDKEVEYGKHSLDTPEKAAQIVEKMLGVTDREHMIVCCVDNRNKPTYIQIVGIGTAKACLFSIPEIFKIAILSGACYIILFHTHTSGEVEPSRDDIRATQKIRKAGEMLDVLLLDHIIVGENGKYYSFKENEEYWEI